jgi:hypothetical protein
MRRLALLLVVLAGACAVTTTPAESRSRSPFAGLGAWISVYDTRAWRAPEATVATLDRHGVRTLYLETSNDRRRTAVERPLVTARFLRAAHARGLRVVGWYLPSFVNTSHSIRRAVAAIRFESPDGERFDGFALDVEATNVRSVPARSRRAVLVAARVRRAAGARYPLGAITIAPVGASPTYWPRFPFRGLARSVDVFLPMAYFTARTKGAAGVAAYTAANVRVIRAAAGDQRFPIHPIGGSATRATPAEVRAFVAAAAGSATIGSSLWEYGQMRPRHWRALTGA